ncbi:VMAP-C domain-containing protein [Nocardia salmonicida]|uniref:VMAP-C domain-containing protein n=1 Tax=Nocardia salmonicida TaxID=53431 RepID=UPI002E2D6032|nr:hypothetical protein [Nocardia salmonicida]
MIADAANTFAVVVSIDVYGTGPAGAAVDEYGRPRTLDAPVPDGYRFIDMLLTKGVPENRIIFLAAQNETATVDYVAMARSRGIDVRSPTFGVLKDLFESEIPAHASDLLIIHWGGHGLQLGSHERFLLCADYKFSNRNVVDLHSLLSRMKSNAYASKHPRQLLLIDACMTNDSARQSLAPMLFTSPTGRTSAPVQQIALLAASQGERAMEKNGRGLFSNIVFTHFSELRSWPPRFASLESDVRGAFDVMRANGTLQTPFVLGRFDGRGEVEFFFENLAISDDSCVRELLDILTKISPSARDAALSRADLPTALGEEWYQNLNVASNSRSILRFSGFVAANPGTHREIKLQMLNWIKKAGAHWDLPKAEVEDILERAIRAPESLYILVHIVESLETFGEPLGLFASVYRGTGKGEPIDEVGDSVWSAKFALELGRVLNAGPLGEPPVVEFMVHHSQWDKQFEKIQVPGPDGSIRSLGEIAVVTISPAERHHEDLRTAARIQRWTRRGADIGSRHSGPEDERIHWMSGDYAEVGASENVLANGRHVWIAVTEPKILSAKVMEQWLDYGVPAAVWIHHSCSYTAGEAKQALLALIGRTPIMSELPHAVLRHRCAARAAATRSAALAYPDLVLLWDDPGRPRPERITYRYPISTNGDYK